MQIEVLRYIHPDYEVIVRTQDINYSWERFKGRINYTRIDNPNIDAPEEYCRYTSKDECKLRLYSPITGTTITQNEGEGAKEWDKKWPVIFETCRYQVRLLFHDVDSRPEIRHVALLREVNEEYENVIYRYLSITLQQFGRGKLNTDATWMAAFQSVVDDYVKNVKRVIQNPHSQIVNYRTSRKADQIKYWNPLMEEQYGEVEKEGKLEEYYFGYNEARSTHDTMENRFVKHTLQSIGKRLSSIISTVLSTTQEELSERHRQMWKDYQDSLKKLSKHPFFKAVGKFDGLKQESLVLQNRVGYQQIYKDWLKLKRGIDFYNGAANIGTLQIWEIYELWCFIKMKKLVAGADGN